MKIFISGASGYLGSQLSRYLSKDHNVVSLVRPASSLVRLKAANSEVVAIGNTKDLDNAFHQHSPDLVINAAAIYGRRGEAVSSLVYANILFPIELFELSEKYNVTTFINTGSSLPKNVSLYASSKAAFINLVETMDAKVKFINIALEHFYGPFDDPFKFTSYVINKCLSNEDLDLTDGNQLRDFIYIDDVLSAYRCVIDNLDNIENKETISLGSGDAPTIRKFVETIHALANSKSKLKFGVKAVRENEVMFSCADTTKMKRMGWEKKFSLKEGILASLKRADL